jgi:RimJ/RimL family protein N-acetyltransferase
MNASINLQPTHLQDEYVTLLPLQETDFERLYLVAADPLIWEQHPQKDRWQRDVFANYFKGAVESKGALLVMDSATGDLIGCSRYYDYDAAAGSIFIGYTFLVRSHWGGSYNRSLKKLMLGHAFTFAETVLFHIGASNIRSQKAMERIGGVRIGIEDVAYYGEKSNPNVVYCITRQDWGVDG